MGTSSLIEKRLSLRDPAVQRLALIAGLVFASAYGGLWLSDVLGRLTAIWIANALLVFFLLRSERRDWPIVMLVGFAANIAGDLVSGDDLFSSAYLTLCNAVGVLIVSWPLVHLKLHEDFSRSKTLYVFYALALGPAPVIAGAMAAVYFHFWIGREYLSSAFDWYATDALCYSIVVPILMTVRGDALRRMFSRQEVVSTLLLLGVIAATMLLNYLARGWPLAFLFFPAVLLVTFRRGFAGGAIGVLMTGTYLMLPVLTGGDTGALKAHSLHQQIIIVQIYMAVTGFSVILVGAALAERRRLEDGLAFAIVRAEASREEAVVARDAAERANRMKSMFLATMSHELRTPLNAIIGFSELIHSQIYGPHRDPRYVEYAGLIQNAGRHLLSLINDILDMSKIEAGKFELHREAFDVRSIVRDCLDLMSARAGQAQVTLADDLPAKPLLIDADQRAIKQILLNLLSNAVKFTREGGRVTVGAKHEGSNIVLKVTDTGVGIAADQLSRLGNPFVQVRSSAGSTHEGTGLGLALVRSLAEIHHGNLKLESRLGYGTTVSVTIPTGEPRAAIADLPRLARIA
ncbi:MAG: ATP-binding protein [Rhizomicrobium sp.]|jgi:signal transduction histidine kinase